MKGSGILPPSTLQGRCKIKVKLAGFCPSENFTLRVIIKQNLQNQEQVLTGGGKGKYYPGLVSQ